MIKTKTKKRLERALSCVLAFVMTASMSTVLPAAAEEVERYPYVILATDKNTGITVDADDFTLNGNAHSNGEFSLTSSYSNINGKITDIDDVEETEEFDVSSDMIFMHNKLTTRYFTDNCLTFDESYTYTVNNVNVHNPIYVTGELNLEGNVTLNNAIGAVSDIELSDGNLNGNNTVIYSKFGDIDISGGQASVNGLIYAPFGTVTIDSDNFNLNGVIIAQSVVISCEGNVNINYNYGVGEMIGVESEELSLDEADIPYLEDTDSDELFDVFEIIIGTDKTNPDTDGDKLTDGYEVLYLGTDPTVVDSDENGVSDADEDFDEDGLTNIQEYEKETDPYNDDTDGDELKDGEEVNTYFTNPIVADTDEDGLDDGDEIHFNANPLNPDTDGDGIPDGNEKRFQTFIHEAENKDSAVTEVRVSMTATGNLEKTTTVESIMGKDILCSEVVGLVGEPFSIETISEFDKATITYVIDKSKLGETEFDNLLFLWYDKENDEFVELDTILDEENSTVSVETTHFSRYLIVNRYEWFEAWNTELDYTQKYNVGYIYDLEIAERVDPLFENENGEVTNFAYELANFYYNSFSEKDLYYGGGIIYNTALTHQTTGITSTSEVIEKLTIPLKHVYGYTLEEGSYRDYLVYDSVFELISKKCSEEDSVVNRTLFVSDGGRRITDEAYEFYLDKFVDEGVIIDIVIIGDVPDNYQLSELARQTGGFYVRVTTPEHIIDSFYPYVETLDLTNKQNSDTDELYDIYEIVGLRLANGQIYTTDPYEEDTDGDGLTDSEEIEPTLYHSEKHFNATDVGHVVIKKYFFIMNSDPTSKDTDGDGLLDGKAQYHTLSNNQNKMIAPIDPEPTKYNGLKNMWATHIEEMKTGVIAHSYDSSNSDSISKTSKWVSKQIVKLLLHARESLDFGLSKTKPILSFLKYLAEDTTEAGAYLLDFVHDEYGEIYHSKPETWQRQFGYNGLYDEVFRISSNMDYGRIEFNVGNKRYALWAWKGDYWNLQSGAEVGLYEYYDEISGTEHFDAIDFEVPMTLSLYNYFSFYDIRNLFNWMPDEEQWWITGFNTKHKNPDPDVMVSVVTIDLSEHTKLYDALKNADEDTDYHEDIHRENLIFDDSSKTVWIQWYT